MNEKVESRLKKNIKYAPIVNEYIAELEIEYETIKKENFSDKAYEKRFNKRKELRGKKHKDTAVKKVEKYKQEKGDVMITFLTNKKSKEKYMLIQRKRHHFHKVDKSITRFQNKTIDDKRIWQQLLIKRKDENLITQAFYWIIFDCLCASIFSSGIVKDAHASSVKRLHR